MSIFNLLNSNKIKQSGINNNTFTKHGANGYDNTAYGKYWIHSNSKTIYSWNIKIDKVTGGDLAFGIVSDKHHQDINKGFNDQHCICINLMNGYVRVNGKFIGYNGPKCKTGDIYGFIVDFEKRELFGMVNNDQSTKKRLCGDIEHGKYRLALSIPYDQERVTVISNNDNMNDDDDEKGKEKENTRLQIENVQINDKLIQSVQEIRSIEQASKRDKETIKEQQDIIEKLQSKYNILMQDNKEIKDENKKLKKQNADLNEEYKDCKLELNDIKTKYNKLYRKHNINIKNYKKWDYDNITDWIISLDEAYQVYENALRNQLKEEALEGTDLADLDTTDLNRFGIKTFKHKKQILNHINTLTQSQNDDHNNIKPFNEGNTDTVYIG